MNQAHVFFLVLLISFVEVKMANAYDPRPRLYDENSREQRQAEERKINRYKRYPIKYVQEDVVDKDSPQLHLDEEDEQECSSNDESD